VYQHFTTPEAKEGEIDKTQTKWACKHCPVGNPLITCNVKLSTGNLWIHLATHNIYSEQKIKKASTDFTQGTLSFPTEGKVLTKSVVEKANYYLGRVIAKDMRTFTLGVSEDFVKFAQTLCPLYTPPSEETMKEMLMDYKDNKLIPRIKEDIALSSGYALTSDGWKSRTKIAMQSLEIHYLDRTGKHCHRIIKISETEAENVDNVQLMKFFTENFTSYGIKSESIICFVIDGGGNQWLALEKLGIPCVWCGCHSIATDIKVGLGVCDAFLKPKTLVTWFNSSYVHTKHLRDLQKKANARIRMSEADFIEHIYVLIQENDTRWNSWYLCIRRIILLWPEIKMVLTDYQKLGILMGDSDIKVLEEFVLLLEPFYDATLSLEKEGSTLSDIVCEIHGLVEHLKAWSKESTYINTDEVAKRMLTKLELLLADYYCCDFVVACVILDRSLGNNFKVLLPENYLKDGIEYIEKEMTKMNSKWKEGTINPRNSISGGGSNTTKSPGKGYKQTVKVTETSKNKTELDLYFESDLPVHGQSMLDWWSSKKNVALMPNLSRIAQRLFMIPGSASMSERTWSTVGHIWTPERNRSSPETVEMLTLLRSNGDLW
jgi:hypothetical protein